ncbi:MAG TPA: hypothetical protein VLV54_11290 [Thermoanaerobaculia bacterium]|nr:hypothetical protein [Thermoanaerobaculia bacterium]
MNGGSSRRSHRRLDWRDLMDHQAIRCAVEQCDITEVLPAALPRPHSVAHLLHFAIDVGICNVFGWSPRGQLRDQVFEASVHLGLDKSMSHTGTGRLIKAMDDGEEIFETEPHVGDGDL